MKRVIVSIAAVAGVVLAGVSVAASADATVSTTAASWTPQITSTDSTVRQLVQCGNTMYAVGSFSTISQGGTSYTRNNAFSFDATTGALTSWDPEPNGVVNSIALSSDCSTAYLGGKFTTVSGTTVRDIVALNTSSGAVVSSFKHSAGSEVNTVLLVDGGDELMVGGNFTSINGTSKALYASLNPTTGAVDNYFSGTVSGQLPNGGSSMVYNQQVSAQGDRLLIEGDFTTVAGGARQQIAELDLSSSGATLDPWSNATINSTGCSYDETFYIRSAGFSPDEQTIYTADTGYEGSSPYCDAVAAFANTPAATNIWVNETGGDSLYAVAASSTDVYVAGHERWANNPDGNNSCGTGCVSRPGLGDIGATSGQATSWDPTRDRGHGADDLLITSAGLWVASDTYFGASKCAGVNHPGICFLPGTA